MDNKSQYCFIAVMLFLKQPFVFGDDCKCEGLVNVFKSTMSREIFDLKMENTMLQARMDKMESMLQEKSSSTSARGLDTARFEGFENRLSSIESNRQHTIKVPTNTLKLHSFIAKALRSEKEKRIQAESNTRKHMEFFNQSISDLKIKVDFVLNSNLTYIVNDIEKVEQKMYDGLDQVKNDIRYLQSNISELQSQSNALSDKDISELGLDLVAMNKSVATDIAEIEQRMSDGFLNVKNKIKTMQTKVKKQYQVNVLIGKNVTAFETGLSTIDQDVMTMKADIKRLEKLSLISLKANKCPELPSIRNGEIFQNTNEGVRNIYGSVAEYTCNIGYSLNGNRSIKVYNRQCQADRTWSGKQPTCDDPTTISEADKRRSKDVLPDKNQIQNTRNEGCTLPGDPRYTYMDFYGFYKDPGSLISDGTILTVACTTLDLYEFYASYDSDYDNNSTSTITCMNNTLSQLELDCPEVIPNTCMELQHGSVNVQNGYFIVSCDKGYSLDLIVPERPQCTCENNQLKSVFGGQTPACIPEKCVVPYVFDVRLSVRDRRRVSLSGGSVVEVGDFVYFNCSKPGELKYEPLNRRFQCVNGLWEEAETDRNWKLGYDGEFPACRRAVCEPNCTNGGVCFKDDNCRCKHLTEGKRCEKFICHDTCFENGGKCVGPGRCSCPAERFGLNCEQKGCILPKHTAKYGDQKIVSPGTTLNNFACDRGYVLSSQKGMTCLDGGTWSEIVTCIKAVVYLISVKTVAAWKNIGEGTDAKVYITLQGLSGKTEKIYLVGSFEAGNLDETRLKAKDVRPITSVVIGHDGSGLRPDWYLEYVSIYVENMEEYYVFRHNDWVEAERDVLLPRQGIDQTTCIDTFDSGHTLWPRWSSIRREDRYDISSRRRMSLRGCKQACINLQVMQCKAVMYSTDDKSCWGFAVSDTRYFEEKHGTWNLPLYLRTCKRSD